MHNSAQDSTSMHVYNTYVCKLIYTRNIDDYVCLYSRNIYKGEEGFDPQPSPEAALTQLFPVHSAFGQRPRKKTSLKKTPR